jgi:hypothetical protein
VTKVPKGETRGFCHFWHPLTSGILKVTALGYGVERRVIQQERPWLAALRSVEERTSKEEKRQENTVFSSPVDDISEAPLQRGAKSLTPSPDGDGVSGVDTTDVKT